MRLRRRKLGISLVAAVLLGLVLWFILRPSPEPVYQGRTLTSWLENYISRGDGGWFLDEATRNETGEAIRHIGTNALPILFQLFESGDSSFETNLIRSAGKQSEPGPRTARQRQTMAVWGFRALGSDARPALPKIAEMFCKASPSNRLEIAKIVSHILPSCPQKPSNANEANYDYLHPAHKLTRSQALKALGEPLVQYADGVEYAIGDLGIGLPGDHGVLHIQFYDDYVVGTFLYSNPLAFSSQIPSKRIIMVEDEWTSGPTNKTP